MNDLPAWKMIQLPDGDLIVSLCRLGREGWREGQGAIYISRDGAATWEPLAMPGNTNFVSDIACDPRNPDRLYAACWVSTDSARSFGPRYDRFGLIEPKPDSGGIYISDDKGVTWDLAFGPEHSTFGLYVNPFDPDFVYAANYNGQLVMTPDAGATWKQIEGYDFYMGQRPYLDVNDPDYMLVTTFGGGVWRGPSEVTPKLGAIILNGETINGFDPNILDYYIEVPHNVNIADLGAVGVYSTAVIDGVGTKALNVGKNVFEITVENRIGTLSQRYTVVIERIGHIGVLSVDNGNGQSLARFPIRSANGKGYTAFISNNASGPFTVYNEVNYNANGVHVKKLDNGKTYYMYLEYNGGSFVERSDIIQLKPSK